MKIREAVSKRIYSLCNDKNFTPNEIANFSGIPQSTLKSILNGESANPGIVYRMSIDTDIVFINNFMKFINRF